MSTTSLTSRLLALLLLSVAFSACASGGKRTPFAFLQRDPVEAASRRVHSAIDKGTAHYHPPLRQEIELRYAPASCACPSWEALLYGRWERIALAPEPTRGQRGMKRARLTLTSATQASSTGWLYPVFTWELDDTHEP